MAVAVVVAPKAAVAKVADQPEVAVAKGMAVDGPVAQAIHPVEGEAMHPLVVGKSKSGATLAESLKAHLAGMGNRAGEEGLAEENLSRLLHDEHDTSHHHLAVTAT